MKLKKIILTAITLSAILVSPISALALDNSIYQEKIEHSHSMSTRMSPCGASCYRRDPYDVRRNPVHVGNGKYVVQIDTYCRSCGGFLGSRTEWV